MVEIQLEEKVPKENSISSDLALAKQICIWITDKEERKRVTSFIDDVEKKKEGHLPIQPSDLSESEMNKGLVTDKQKEEYRMVESALEVAERGGYLRAIELVAGIEDRQGTKLLKAHAFGLLAEILDKGGIDVTPVFILAMDHIRDFMNNTDSLGAVEGVEITEAVLKKALDLGYFNVISFSAQRTMDQVVKLKDEGKEVDMYLLMSVASFLGLSVRAQGRR